MGNKLARQHGAEDPASTPLLADLENPTRLLANLEDDPPVTNDQLLAVELLAVELLAVVKNHTVTNDQLLAVVEDLAGTVENGRHESPEENETEAVERSIIRTWKRWVEFLKKLLFTPALPVQLEDDSSEEEEIAQRRERQYSEGIVPARDGFGIKIKGPGDLDSIEKLVKEKIELEKYMETIFKSGRESRKDFIISTAGTLFLGILNAVVAGLLADHIPFEIRMIVLGIFCATFVLFFGAAMYEQNLIYKQALVDARSSHSTMIRSMNVRRNVLMVKLSELIQEEDLDEDEKKLADEAERHLNKLLQEYCEKIVQPLPISRQRTAAFVSLGCFVVVLIFASVLKAMEILISPATAPAPAPAPAPYFFG